MDIVSQQKQVLEGLLAENPSVGIVISSYQNLDIVAAALSLQLILQDSGKNSQIVSSKEPIVEYSSLVGIDQITSSFAGVMKTLTVSFPYKEGEIEKVSYNIEGDRLNVNLFGDEKGITIQEKDIKYIKQGTSPSLLFVIGARDLSEIQEFSGTGAKIVNVDNDPANTLFGDVVLVDPSFSSLSEMVAKLALLMGLTVEFDVAQNLLDGVSFATQNFSSIKTSPAAFETASILMQKGAVRRNLKDARPISNDTSLSKLTKNQALQQQPSIQKPFLGKQTPQNPGFHIQNNSNIFNNQNPPQVVPDDFGNTRIPVQPFQQVPSTPPASTRPGTPSPEEFSMNTETPNSENIPAEEDAPSDWFVPKVFKSTKNQG